MMSNLGQPIARADGSVKVTGIARYAGDQNQPGQLHAVLVASTVPAGRVSAIDTRAALAIPGVTRVLVAVEAMAAGASPLLNSSAFGIE
jgi:xanthine dehydrogenase YagR molybdenum-binding subunit